MLLTSYDNETNKHDAECGNRVDEPINLYGLQRATQMKSMILPFQIFLQLRMQFRLGKKGTRDVDYVSKRNLVAETEETFIVPAELCK